MTITIKYNLVLILGVSLLLSCDVVRSFKHGVPTIQDAYKFQHRDLTAAPVGFELPKARSSPPLYAGFHRPVNIGQFVQKTGTNALLVIQNDSIIYHYHTDSITAQFGSFSIAKSITSLLIGCAINDGFIESVDIKITSIIPEIDKEKFADITLEHLLQMTAGLYFPEGLLYYGNDFENEIRRLNTVRKPGQHFEYWSAINQLIGLILQRSLPDISITEYLQIKLWTPLKMPHASSWSIDKNGLEKTYCCINTTATDLAILGTLVKNRGIHNGDTLIPPQWIDKSFQRDNANGSSLKYQYQWWVIQESPLQVIAKGLKGQYLFIEPESNVIIVRQGPSRGLHTSKRWVTSLQRISESIKNSQ